VLAGSGLFYLALAVAFVRLSLASRPTSDDEAVRQWTAWLMAQPFGRVLLAMIAGGFVAIAFGLAVKAYRVPERHRLKIRQRFRRWILLAGSFGTLTRAVVFLLIGIFLALAAYDSNSREAASLAGVLRALQQQAYGAILLAIAAIGLLAFGLFEIIEAATRRTEPANRPARQRES
jgi:sterol desaturase/sphingolipid hydroxylase (fatty acid hydroxylase superfamily)